MIIVVVMMLVGLMFPSQDVGAQQRRGEVLGSITAGTYKYHGEFSDDLWGPVGTASLQLALFDRWSVEGRWGLGEIRWKVTPSLMAAYPQYFGRGARLGGRYPGTLTTIEPENASRITTADVLVHYVLVDNIPAIPYVMAGVGMVNFSPTNDREHEALPNNAFRRYSRTVVSLPVGAGVRFPLSDEVELSLRGEYRFVFSPWLDDFTVNHRNDGLSSVSVGLSYRFTAVRSETVVPELLPLPPLPPRPREPRTCIVDDAAPLETCIVQGAPSCSSCCCCCCCCYCCGEGTGKGAGSAEGSGQEFPPEPPIQPREAFSKDVRFHVDSDEFDFSEPETERNLSELLDYLANAPEGHEVILEGHASGDGPAERNDSLSLRRAERVRDWLLEKGVRPDVIRGVVGYGSSRPKVPEPTPQEQATMTWDEIEAIREQNRRIEVRIVHDAYKREADQQRQQQLELQRREQRGS